MSYHLRQQVHAQMPTETEPYYAREVNDTSMDGRVSSRFSALETDASRRKKMAVVQGECHGCRQKYDNQDYRFCPWCGQMKSCMACGGMGRVKKKVTHAKYDDGHTEETEVAVECERCVGTGREPTK